MLPSHALMLGGQIAIRKGQCSKRFFRSKGFYFEKFLFGKVIFPTGKFMEIHYCERFFFIPKVIITKGFILKGQHSERLLLRKSLFKILNTKT